MIVFYILGFLLLCGATVILLELTPERITNDLMKFISPQQTLRDKEVLQVAETVKKDDAAAMYKEV